MIPKVVILAAGRGTRMRRSDPTSQLSDQQAAMASRGMKAMIPIDRPFLDYVLNRVADAGYHEVCLVIGRDHDTIRDYYDRVSKRRLRISFAVQQEAWGTAHALVAAQSFVGEDHCIVLNSDNCYPTQALQALREAEDAAIIGYDRDSLVAHGNIAPDRIARFALVEPDADGWLRRIVEKPDPAELAQLPPPILVSMNCWRFAPAIFHACLMTSRSRRCEYELPDAVSISIRDLAQRYEVIRSTQGVLDLSNQRDVANAVRQLAEEDVQL